MVVRHMTHRHYRWFVVFLLLSVGYDGNADDHVDIKGPPVVSPGYFDQYMANEGDNVKIICPIIAIPKPLIEWYQGDHRIQPTWERFRVNKNYLKIRDVRLSDSGVFICKGVNGFGSLDVELSLVVRDFKDFNGKNPSAHQGSINSFSNIMLESNIDFKDEKYEGPKFIRKTPVFGDVITLNSGDTLKLECLVEGRPKPTVTWYKGDDILLTRGLSSGRTESTLVISDLKVNDDEGVYKCKARNGFGEVNASFPVKINDQIVPPEILGPPKANKSLAEWAFVFLNCEAISPGSTQVQWLKQLHDEQIPKDKNKTIVVFDYTFEILPITFMSRGDNSFYNASLRVEHVPGQGSNIAGRYICLVNNHHGHAYKEVFITATDTQMQDGSKFDLKRSAMDEVSLTLVLVISIPAVSLSLLTVLIFAVCCKRSKHSPLDLKPATVNNLDLSNHYTTRPNSSSNGSVLTASLTPDNRVKSNVFVNTSIGNASPYASSAIASKGNVNSGWNYKNLDVTGKNGNNDNTSTTSATVTATSYSPFFPIKHWKQVSSKDDSSGYVEIGTGPSPQPSIDDENWVEVTNKANQTPSHWVYSDMISGSNQGNMLENEYSLPNDVDSAIYSASTSLTNSPLLKKGIRSPIVKIPLVPASSSSALTKPLPPPYSSTSHHLFQNQLANSAIPLSALPGGRSPLTARVFQKTVASNIKDVNREFFAIVRQSQQSQQKALETSPTYEKPTSKHLYFEKGKCKADFI